MASLGFKLDVHINEPKYGYTIWKESFKCLICKRLTNFQWRSQPDNLVPLCKFQAFFDLLLFISLEIHSFRIHSFHILIMAHFDRRIQKKQNIFSW